MSQEAALSLDDALEEFVDFEHGHQLAPPKVVSPTDGRHQNSGVGRNPEANYLERTQVSRLRNWHEMLSIAMIANPHWSNKDLASYFKKSEKWISIITRSDLFLEAHNARREQYGLKAEDAVLRRWEQLNHKVLDRMEEALDKDKVKPETLNRMANTALGALGYGNSKSVNESNGTKINIMIPGADLERAKARRDAQSAQDAEYTDG